MLFAVKPSRLPKPLVCRQMSCFMRCVREFFDMYTFFSAHVPLVNTFLVQGPICKQRQLHFKPTCFNQDSWVPSWKTVAQNSESKFTGEPVFRFFFFFFVPFLMVFFFYRFFWFFSTAFAFDFCFCFNCLLLHLLLLFAFPSAFAFSRKHCEGFFRKIP